MVWALLKWFGRALNFVWLPFEFRLACFARVLPASAILGLFGHSLVCLGTAQVVWALLDFFGFARLHLQCFFQLSCFVFNLVLTMVLGCFH